MSSPPDGPQQQVTKSVYTVTTPASFVFFEQTISPSGASSSSTKLGETNKKFINPRSRARTRGPSKSKVSSKANDIAEPTPSQKKQEKFAKKPLGITFLACFGRLAFSKVRKKL